MKQRSPPFDLPAEPLCLFLDVDGTLLEFASTPEGVIVTAGALLSGMVISGRLSAGTGSPVLSNNS